MMPSIVVSGGSKGIGKAIVKLFLEKGFKVFTCSRNEENLSTLKSELNTFGAHLYTFTADLSKKDDVSLFAEYVKSQTEVVDILVNNSGVFLPGSIADEEEGVLEQQIETNVYSAYRLTRAFLPMMKVQKAGHIFNMCSVASIKGYPNGGSYCVSKFALLGMTKVLREELMEDNIRVTAIIPGATMTASWEGVDVSPERLMKPEDVAYAVWGAHTMSKNSVVEEIVIRPQLGDL